MTSQVVPDLRARVSERLDGPSSSVAWWQPALACAVLVIILGWWLMPQAQRERNPAPVVAVRSAPASSATRGPRVESRTPRGGRPAVVATRRPPRRVAQPEDVPWTPDVVIAPLAVEPLRVDGVDAGPIEIDVRPIPELVVEALYVEPLPRSNP